MCILFQEKYVSCYILLTDQISLSGRLDFNFHYFFQSWVLKWNLIYKPLSIGAGSGRLISMLQNVGLLILPLLPLSEALGHCQNYKVRA